jgi:hypothetical protein
MKLDPRVEELIKEFEEELASLYSYYGEPTEITVTGPVLRLYEEGIEICLTKLSDKEYLVYCIDEDGASHVKIFKFPDEVRKFLGWDWQIKECRESKEELTQEEKDKVRKLLRDGRDIAYIHKTTGIHPCDIYYFAKTENLPINLPIKVESKSERR